MVRAILEVGYLIFLGLSATVHGKMEGYVVGGQVVTDMTQYSHSAFLNIRCANEEGFRKSWICGSSVINQQILMTAGHCLAGCQPGTHVGIRVGNELRNKGVARSGHSFVVHQDYDDSSSNSDIALIRLMVPLKLNSKIARVALMKSPPYDEPAEVAGWGLTNELIKQQGYKLKVSKQTLLSKQECEDHFGYVSAGTICGISDLTEGYAARGDSGSALVVRGYIQIGLVSFKVPAVATNIITYTDVGYYYNWITTNSKRLACQ